ncbi:hypothetical protein [Bdellovibrio bacteriovorus]|uniref:Uncharacterized protein n=1 Tax=Bdellovibrio bacteriovorus TaxID=959 RepID=A0A150WTC1_BDEBC|nr:hypothetical protein [Bdellovibrio bacteriovorus]KYG67578.1 hypothetical protein AZI85_17365 [Bdellovibrio bacteriovorus]
MKKVITFILIALTGSQVFAADSCKRKVVKAAIQQAQLDREESEIQHPVLHLLSSEFQGDRLISVYEADLLHCTPGDLDACGSLTYEVVTAETNSSCQVLRIYMTGEE